MIKSSYRQAGDGDFSFQRNVAGDFSAAGPNMLKLVGFTFFEVAVCCKNVLYLGVLTFYATHWSNVSCFYRECCVIAFTEFLALLLQDYWHQATFFQPPVQYLVNHSLFVSRNIFNP